MIMMMMIMMMMIMMMMMMMKMMMIIIIIIIIAATGSVGYVLFCTLQNGSLIYRDCPIAYTVFREGS